MLNSRRRSSSVFDDSHLDRWLVSYADYMTLLFALFVVLYAFALVKEERYQMLSNSFGEIFHLEGKDAMGGQGKIVQNTSDTPETSGDKIQEINDFNKGVLTEVGSEPIEGDSNLITPNAKKLGTPFSSLKEKLSTDLLEVVEDGMAQLEEDENWLTIEFRSGLLFDSGSATTREKTKQVLKQVIDTIAPANNFIHVRGYTDDQPISNEQFTSNWQLSAARASAIVQELQALDIEPQRLAIEAYGQYKPKTQNESVQGRASNRRVVIAISRYGWTAPNEKPIELTEQQVEKLLTKKVAEKLSNEIRIIELPNGGLRVTTRTED